MILVKPSFEVMEVMGIYGAEGIGRDALELIEKAGRTCYKSESAITGESAKKFVQKINKLGHESVIEHSAMTVRIICDRGVAHEIVRHRLAAYSQESTRYVNYKGGCSFVIPLWLDLIECNTWSEVGSYILPLISTLEHSEAIDLYGDKAMQWWLTAMFGCERAYMALLAKDWSPQQARSVLPNSTKTEIVITANFREWRHIFRLRCAKAAHPQMREVMIPLHKKCKELIPVIFDDIEY